MLNRTAIIKSLSTAKDEIEWSDVLSDDYREEHIECIDELIEAAKSERPDQEVDDLAFKLGLDGHLFWHKEN